MTLRQIFSHPTRSNSVIKHIIIWHIDTRWKFKQFCFNLKGARGTTRKKDSTIREAILVLWISLIKFLLLWYFFQVIKVVISYVIMQFIHHPCWIAFFFFSVWEMKLMEEKIMMIKIIFIDPLNTHMFRIFNLTEGNYVVILMIIIRYLAFWSSVYD